ncbi:disease resistance protein RGA2-like [Mangifera indica]|uniref:disease resistance protein RGA2-like n=1 Tax=Mangifera indica TaxID=29780 RepID=UPI001CF96D21|nr:disease resistance protein RGA2-like [Mangifera indica]
MAESIVFGIASEVLKKIASLIGGELSLLWGLENDLRRLQRTMTTINAVLLDAETKQTQNHQLRDWLGKLRDVFYGAEDVLEEFEFHAARRQRRTSISKVRQYFPSRSSIKIGYKIKDIRERLDEIADARQKFHLVESHVDVRRVIPKERETNPFFQASDVIGREEDKENMISILTQTNHDNVSVIPIVGIGGLGKTTLSKMVYNDVRVNSHFKLKMWVCVSDDFDVNRLMKEMIYSATNKDCAELKAEKIPKRLQEILGDGKFLLVLDDVWNEEPMKWMDLKSLLLKGVNGSKIIVSTRSKRVADIMGTISPHFMQGLSFEDSLSLFKRCAFKEGEGKEFPNLCKIAKEIVGKCKGVPLAIRTLGSLLFANTDETEWLKIKKNDIWQLKQEKEDILPVLKLSYDYLPSHLKRCFVYLSLFPKDYIYRSDDVTGHWMTHRLLLTSNNELEELEDVAMRYMKDLWCRCFIEDFEEINHLHYTFKMHDLMHDLATLVATSECAVIKSTSQIIDGSVRHITFDDVHLKPQEFQQVLVNRSKTVRSIIILEKYEYGTNESIINTNISKFTHLQLLSLNNLAREVLPNSIGTLIHLRYLDLGRNYLLQKFSKSICELPKLDTFLFSGCLGLKKLPRKIRKMISLRRVEITTGEQHLRENGIECLSSLQYLLFSQCVYLVTLPGGMKGLTGLRTLYIKSCDLIASLPYGIKYLKRLQKLVIEDCFRLNLRMEFQGENEDNLRLGVQTFVIIDLPSLVDLPQLILRGSANTLQRMRIEGCHNLVELPEWLQDLTSLQTLEIINCPELSRLPEGMQHLTALRQLKIKHCLDLSESCRRDKSKTAHITEKNLAEKILYDTATEILKKIGSLIGGEVLWLWDLKSDLRRLEGTMSTLKAVLLEAETKQTQDHQLRDWLGKLRDVFYDAEDVLEEFEFHASRRQWGSSISKASEVIGREEDKENIISFLIQPTHVNVSVIPIVGIGGLGKTTFSKMVYNDERGCDNLKADKIPKHLQEILGGQKFLVVLDDVWNEQPMKWMNLKSLLLNGVNESKIIVSTCSKSCQNNGHCLPIFHARSNNLVALSEGMKGLTGLRALYIERCPLITSLPNGIKYRKRLQMLMISSCSVLNLKMEFQGENEDYLRLGVRTFIIIDLLSLVDLPQLILQRDTLQCMRIESCPTLEKLPEWLQNLASLQALAINDCPGLSHLPKGMQRLTTLRQH